MGERQGRKNVTKEIANIANISWDKVTSGRRSVQEPTTFSAFSAQISHFCSFLGHFKSQSSLSFSHSFIILITTFVKTHPTYFYFLQPFFDFLLATDTPLPPRLRAIILVAITELLQQSGSIGVLSSLCPIHGMEEKIKANFFCHL